MQVISLGEFVLLVLSFVFIYVYAKTLFEKNNNNNNLTNNKK